MKIELHHINLSSDKVDEMNDFYLNVMKLKTETQGLPILEKKKGYSGDVAFVSDGKIQTHLAEKDLDVCAVWQTIHPPNNYNFGVETGQYYTNHRQGGWDELNKISDKYKIIAEKLHPQMTQDVMRRSKVGISPYGQCEVCYRDLEIIQWGSLLIKPDMSKVITEPDFYKPMETYVPVKPDWSDLNETIEKVLANYKDYQYIIDNARQKVVEMYSYENVCMYWYNFFSNMSGVENA